MTLLLLYIMLALGISFYCSIMEAVLLSVNSGFVAGMEQRRPRLGRALREMKEQVDKPLAAILSLNTIAHTVGAAGAGAQAVTVFGEAFLGVISGVLTFVILVFSEIIPKTIGAIYWRRLVPLSVHALRMTIWLMWPLVKLAQGVTHVISRSGKKRFVRLEEFVALAMLGIREGLFGKYESRILNDLFRIRDVRAKDIMTPRTVLFALCEDDTVGEVLRLNKDLPFSRIPLYTENLDDSKSFVLKSDLLLAAARQQGETPLAALKRPLLVVPDIISLPQLFDALTYKRHHIALVVNEYGGTEGVVTLEDLVEKLLGFEIVDEYDKVTDMRELAREKWKTRATRHDIRDT